LNKSDDPQFIGLDLGSSYIKAVVPGAANQPAATFLLRTGYSYSGALSEITAHFKHNGAIVGDNVQIGVTGYGRDQCDALVRKTEIFALAEGMKRSGIFDATLVDIGGQDSKVLKIRQGKLIDHALNRRCAAGTGSYLEFLSFRLNMDVTEMNRLAGMESDYHPLNSFCTVFAGTEILDCIKKQISLPKLIRGMYASVAERVREMTSLEAPVYLSGGVTAHHPQLLDVFKTILGVDAVQAPHPQYLAALGIALHAKEHYTHVIKGENI